MSFDECESSAERAAPAQASDKPNAASTGYPTILTSSGVKMRKSMGHDLSLYQRPIIPGNRGPAWRAAWYLVNAWFFQSAVFALIPSSWKASILRAFGARVRTGFVCKPRVTIKYPWFLDIGDHVWLGELGLDRQPHDGQARQQRLHQSGGVFVHRQSRLERQGLPVFLQAHRDW